MATDTSLERYLNSKEYQNLASDMDSRIATYITSEAFKFFVMEFFEMFNHTVATKDGLLFHSDVYHNFCNSNWVYPLTERLQSDIQTLYFEKRFFKNERQLFAVIFAYMNNLTYKQIMRISDRRSARLSIKILNYFLLNRKQEDFKVSDLNNLKNVDLYVTGFGRTTPLHAKLNDSTVVTDDGNIFEIE